jgi:hypothetical protein
MHGIEEVIHIGFLSPGGGAIRAESGIILNLCSSPQKDTHDTNINKH